MGHPNKQSLVITTSGSRSIHDIARDLGAAGFEVNEILETINVVTGSAQADTKERLRAVHGVTDVSDDQPVDIGPPGAPIS